MCTAVIHASRPVPGVRKVWLALLKRAYTLGLKSGKVSRGSVPAFPSLSENAPRKGFIDEAQYSRLAEQCAKEGLWLRALLAAAFDLGWRRQELLGLKVHQVDLLNRRVYLLDSKNGEPRTGVLTDEAQRWLTQCVVGKHKDAYVFSHDTAGERRIGDFRKRWQRVCTAAGVPGLFIHDLRRSMARKLRNLGIAESVIMKKAGWKTASMFRRYGIVNDADLEQAARAVDAQREQAAQRSQDGHNSTQNDAITSQAVAVN